MKRLIIFGAPVLRSFAKWGSLATILIGLSVTCHGQHRTDASALKTVQLSKPSTTGPLSLEQALAQRRSIRQFTSQQLDFTQIGQLAWAGQGITEPTSGFRTAPSAGAIYPIKLYFATPNGLFVYLPQKHCLEITLSKDLRNQLATAAFNQDSVAQAGCDIIIAGAVRKLATRYGPKAERFMLLEAGHIAQNIHLQAVSLGLGSVPIGAFDITRVRKICGLSGNLEPIYIISVGYPPTQSEQQTEQPKQDTQPEATKKKTAALIIASRNFRDEELFETQQVLNDAGIVTVVASSKTGFIKGMLDGKAEATVLVDELNVDNYNAIIFIGGSGATEYFNNQTALQIARDAAEKKKVLAAICIAPSVLANAGLLDGRKATSFNSEGPRLRKAGAEYTGASVEKDGLIITANGPKAATKFGRTIAKTITNR